MSLDLPVTWVRVGQTGDETHRVTYLAARVSHPEVTVFVDGLPGTFVDPYEKFEGKVVDRFLEFAKLAVDTV